MCASTEFRYHSQAIIIYKKLELFMEINRKQLKNVLYDT